MSINLKLIITACAAALLMGCGGGGSSPQNATPLTGVFLDSVVSGISYLTETQSGTTNAAGEFKYISGEQITFSVGSIVLPSVAAGSVITPLDIAGTLRVDDTKVVNLLVFLQSLDADGDPSNGISIPPSAITNATTNLDFTQATIVFRAESAFTTLVASIPNAELKTEAQALAHFVETLKDQNDQVTIGGGGGSSPENATPLTTQHYTEVIGAIPDLGYVADALGGRAGLVYPVMMDVNGDGLDDLVLHFWSPAGTLNGVSPPTLFESTDPCLNKLVILINKGYYKFQDETRTYIKGTDDLGGCSRMAKVIDLNNDGKSDIIYSINQEDGRDSGINLSNWAARNAALISNIDGTYSVQLFDIKFYHHSIGYGYQSNTEPFATAGGIVMEQHWTGFGRNGEQTILQTLVPARNNQQDDGLYSTNNLPITSGSTFQYFTDSITDKTSTSLIQPSKEGEAEIIGFYKVDGNWLMANSLSNPYPVVGTVNFLGWASAETKTVSVRNMNGVYILVSTFYNSCAMRLSPSSPMIAVLSNNGGAVPLDYVLGQDKIIKEQEVIPFVSLDGFNITNGSITSVPLNINNQQIYNQNTNIIECLDVNNDNYTDIVLYPLSLTGHPIVYLNNQKNGFEYVSDSVYPNLNFSWNRGSSILHKFSKSGFNDLIIFPTNIESQGNITNPPNKTTTTFHFFKGIKQLN